MLVGVMLFLVTTTIVSFFRLSFKVHSNQYSHTYKAERYSLGHGFTALVFEGMILAAQTYPSTEQHQTFLLLLLLLLVLLLGSIRYDPFMMYTTDGLVSKTANTLGGYHTHFLDAALMMVVDSFRSNNSNYSTRLSKKKICPSCCDSWKHFFCSRCLVLSCPSFSTHLC